VGSRVLGADAPPEADGQVVASLHRRHARPVLRILAVSLAVVLVGSMSGASVAGREGSGGSRAAGAAQPASGSGSATAAVEPLPARPLTAGSSALGAAPPETTTTSLPPTATTAAPPPRPLTTGGADAWPTAADLAMAAASIDLVFHVPTKQKVVALTFDDGWSPARGQRILEILEQQHVAATFFVNAVYVRWAPALWREIAAAGFPIGNHTYLHRDVTKLTTAQVVAELDRNARVFEDLTGYTLAPLFRPPFGARNRATDIAAALAGYPDVILWNTSAGDATLDASPAREIANATRGGPGSIVLMHVGPVTTPKILTRVIESYRARGFTFVTIPELLALQG